MAKEGISAEVINLRSIRPLDMDCVNESLTKTGHLITVEGGWPHHGVGAEIAAQVQYMIQQYYVQHDIVIARCHCGTWKSLSHLATLFPDFAKRDLS